MAVSVFVCFDPADQEQVEAFNALKGSSTHVFDAHDRSVKETAPDGGERSVLCPFNDARAKTVRDEITKKLQGCDKLVVLVGKDTHKDAWTEWAVNAFHKMKDSLAPGKAWTRIRAMSLKGYESALSPRALESKSTKRLEWAVEILEQWLAEAPAL